MERELDRNRQKESNDEERVMERRREGAGRRVGAYPPGWSQCVLVP